MSEPDVTRLFGDALSALPPVPRHFTLYFLFESDELTDESRALLPEILSYDPTRPASFPDNGRTLTDDAADVFLAVLTNRKITEDKVGPHSDLLAEFPYLGPPHSG